MTRSALCVFAAPVSYSLNDNRRVFSTFYLFAIDNDNTVYSMRVHQATTKNIAGTIGDTIEGERWCHVLWDGFN